MEIEGGRIISLTTEDGKRWRGAVFADCSYVMAQSHVSYTWGRESSAEYGEDLAGVREHTPGHQFGWAMSPYDGQHHLLPRWMQGRWLRRVPRQEGASLQFSINSHE